MAMERAPPRVWLRNGVPCFVESTIDTSSLPSLPILQ
jgi:hypothetical protein